jgi:hypothetical protein
MMNAFDLMREIVPVIREFDLGVIGVRHDSNILPDRQSMAVDHVT